MSAGMDPAVDVPGEVRPTVDERTVEDIAADCTVALRGDAYAPHFHDEDQIAWMRAGAADVTIRDETWHLDGGVVAWIPAGVRHAMTFPTSGVLVSAYLPRNLRPPAARWSAPRALEGEPLVTAILTHLAEGPRGGERLRRSHALLVDLLAGMPEVHRLASYPRDPRLTPIAEALRSDPADARELADWAAELAVSTKTLERAFARTTGTTFRRWRARTRLAAGADLLTRGIAVAEVAHRVGYANPSSFIAAFVERFGSTPGRFAREAAERATA